MKLNGIIAFPGPRVILYSFHPWPHPNFALKNFKFGIFSMSMDWNKNSEAKLRVDQMAPCSRVLELQSPTLWGKIFVFLFFIFLSQTSLSSIQLLIT